MRKTRLLRTIERIAGVVTLIVGIVVPCRAQTRSGPLVYVTNQNDGTVSVIDASSNTVVKTISLCGDCGPAPKGLAITPDGKFVYVANSGNGTVSVIDTSTNTVPTTIQLCSDCASGPVGVAITPDGTRAYVTDTPQNTIEVIDINPLDETYNTVTARITADVSGPGAIAISRDGLAAFYTFGTNSVGRIDTNPSDGDIYNTHTTTLTVGTNPTGVALTPDSAFLYVTNQGDNTVSVITNNFPNFTPVTTISTGADTGPYSVAITPNGQFAYVVNQTAATVSVINTATYAVAAPISLSCLFTPYQIAITLDGSEAWVADTVCGADVISTASNTQTTNVGVGSGPFGVAVSGRVSETQTLVAGVQAIYRFNTDDNVKVTSGTGGQTLTITFVPALYATFTPPPNFSNERCIPFGDISPTSPAAPLGSDFCGLLQFDCSYRGVLNGGDCTTYPYDLLVVYDLPPNLPAIGGPDSLIIRGFPCPTLGVNAQSIFYSYSTARFDPTTHSGGSGTGSCVETTYTPGAPLITSGTTSRFVGWGAPVSDTQLNMVKAGSTRPLQFQLFDIFGNTVTNLSLCESFTVISGLNVCTDPTVPAPWANFAYFQIACPNTAAVDTATDTTITSPGNSGLSNNGGGSYTLPWQTSKSWKGSCANIRVNFDSGLGLTPAALGFEFN
jgi:YVTN family beta-propeller protein